MYRSRWEFIRPSTSVPFPSSDDALNDLRANAQGFVRKEIYYVNKNLTKIVVTVWDTEEAAQAFMSANAGLMQEAGTSLTTHCDTHNIIATRTIETV